MVIAPLLVVKVNWACTSAGNASSSADRARSLSLSIVLVLLVRCTGWHCQLHGFVYRCFFFLLLNAVPEEYFLCFFQKSCRHLFCGFGCGLFAHMFEFVKRGHGHLSIPHQFAGMGMHQKHLD